MTKGQLSKKQLKKLKRQAKKTEKLYTLQENTQKIVQVVQAGSQGQEQQLQNDQDIDFNHIQSKQNQAQQKIDVTFLIAQIREQYYHSMKTVLLRYGQIVGITDSQLASEILQKANYGNVVIAQDDQDDEDQSQNNDGKSPSSDQKQEQDKQEEDDELNVYNVLTLLPSSSKIVEKVKKVALTAVEKQKGQKYYAEISQILKSPKSCSLMINTRLPNLPSFIVPDFHEVFASDLQQLRKSNKKLVLFSSQYVLNISEVQIEKGKGLGLEQIIFSKFEDYQFCKKSVGWWIGQNVKSQRTKADLRRLYFLIRYKDYLEAVKNIRGYLEEEQS